MKNITFYSCKPYLYIALHKERGMSVTFSKDCMYTATNPIELQLLREYAENTRAFYLIAEAGGELEHEDLIRLHNQCEEKIVQEAEQRQAEREQAELKRKEEHDFYSMLRGSDKAYR